MAKHEVKINQADYTVLVFIPDSASTDGSGKTGLVAANLTVSGVRVETDNDVTVTDYTGSLNDLAALTTAHTDWGVLEVSSTLAPGLYRLDIADAIFATGAWSAVVYVMVTTSAAAASPMEFVMVPDAPITGVNVSLWNYLATVALPLVPTTAGRTLDVTATGAAGIDWANVENPTTTLDLSGTTIKTTQKVDIDTIKTNPVVNAGTITFPTNATVASTANITGGTITTVTTLTGHTPQTGDVFPLASTEIAEIYAAVITNAAGADIAADIIAIKAETAAIKLKTDNLPSDPADESLIIAATDAITAAIAAVQADLPQRITKNVALAGFPFFMASSADHVTGKTGLTITATRSLDGAAFAACANAVTELSGGWYKISFAATDTNANTIGFNFDGGALADPVNFTVVTEPT